MVEYCLGDIRRRGRSKEEGIERLFEGRNIVDQFRYRLDIRLEPSFNDLDLIGKMDCGRSEGWGVEGRFFQSNGDQAQEPANNLERRLRGGFCHF